MPASGDDEATGALGDFAHPVEAAGAICWRRSAANELELLLVRSARWDEWSWPKGKMDPQERLPEAAVREVQEETGVRVMLGPPLPSVRYVMPDRRHKRVTYWAAQISDQGQPTASRAEIAEFTCLSVQEAQARLTRRADSAPLDRLLKLSRDGRLEAGQLIVVRHAKAVGRSAWKRDDASRPLAEVGIRQSARLAQLLDCWRPDRLVSSPWSRCLGTLTPYEAVSGITIEPDRLLTERSYAKHPRRTRRRVLELLAEPGRIVICTHRPVLAAVAGALTEQGDSRVRERLPEGDPWLAPGQMLIAHHRAGRVFAVETH